MCIYLLCRAYPYYTQATSHLRFLGCTAKLSSNNPILVGDPGGFNHLEKYESQREGLSHILMENKKCSKPPTSKNGLS